MKKEFKIYKEGVTDKPVTILSKNGEPFNKECKKLKYLMLGYEVIEIDN